ncbi:MAG: AraC family transcriptional regulator [Pseudomonadota bacterium]|nr:AraC family transcriptional regulator [Pseudomonadota bacterium]
MEPIRRAVWYIESHFAEPIGLDDVAGASGLSRFHLSRIFAQATGRSVTAYLRARRLSEAAKTLAGEGGEILPVALAVGYGSHEAFTRAFRDQFGVTPETVRTRRSLDSLDLTEPFKMSDVKAAGLADPVIREEGPFFMAGIREFRTFEERAGIPGQWQRFAPHIGRTPGQIGRDAYGVCFAPSSGEEGFDYMPAVAVTSLDDLPEGLSGARIPRRRYAVFRHEDHVSTIGATCAAIYSEWQPKAGVKVGEGPLMLIEHYGESFNPATGRGGVEIWAPLAG